MWCETSAVFGDRALRFPPFISSPLTHRISVSPSDEWGQTSFQKDSHVPSTQNKEKPKGLELHPQDSQAGRGLCQVLQIWQSRNFQELQARTSSGPGRESVGPKPRTQLPSATAYKCAIGGAAVCPLQGEPTIQIFMYSLPMFKC